MERKRREEKSENSIDERKWSQLQSTEIEDEYWDKLTNEIFLVDKHNYDTNPTSVRGGHERMIWKEKNENKLHTKP